ncbi:MAG: aminopeptidase P N-terminal domain-containing protein [Myxococcales bacterium]|nr:aminopeptidase P N-terminal domain-containing protein [Myxococcales bacterium]
MHTLTTTPSPSLEAYRLRRQRVAERMADDSALLLHGGLLRTRSNDTEFRFRPDSNFHYLSGLREPGALLLLRPGHDPEFTVFVRPRDPQAEIWTGRRIGPEGAIERYGADAAYPIDEASTHLRTLLDGVSTIYLPFGHDAGLEAMVHRTIDFLRKRNRYGEQAPEQLVDARALLGEDRLVKDAAALASLRRAVDVSARGHLAAIRATRPGLYEHELEALLEFHFRRLGSSGPGYGSIVGAGDNATILHYVDNDCRLEAGDLLLIDAGAEWDYFTGDITRTFPISGRFSPAQRDLYAIVLAANEAGIAASRVGSTIDGIYRVCLRTLLQGLRDLRLVDGEVDALLEDESTYSRYTCHRHSHWLGADVHDAGHYCLRRTPRPLKPGYVITVEPGLYIAKDDERAPPELRGVGIRVEDDVLIRDVGPEILSAAVPKAVAELEALIGSEPFPGRDG